MKKYIGYRAEDRATPYAKFYNETIAALPPHVVQALEKPPLPLGALPPLEQAPELLKTGYAEVETGFTTEPDGSLRVAVLTTMPNVTPEMWDWWFGWHGSHDNRYKLWHPQMHQSAEWKDGRDDLMGYVGRTSMIEEYIGKRMEKANIRFVSPSELGFDPQKLEDKKQVVFICARLGYTHLPLEVGWLVHQIRAVEGGAEMRSRFWLGGPHIQLRIKGIPAQWASKLLQKAHHLSAQQGKDILIHCAEEMRHLAAFLPQLYAEMHTC